jgi:hypothetical protein
MLRVTAGRCLAVPFALSFAASCGGEADESDEASGRGGSSTAGTSSGGKGGKAAGGPSTSGSTSAGSTNGGSSNAGSPAAGGDGASTAEGGNDASGGSPTTGDCGLFLATKACQGDARCDWTDEAECFTGYCDCNGGSWACVQTQTDNCRGVCPPPEEAPCGSSCSGEISNCQCACGGPNFSGCTCSNGEWACLGCQ